MSLYHRAQVEAYLGQADSSAVHCPALVVELMTMSLLYRSVVDRFVNRCCQDGESLEKESIQDVLNAISKYKREKVCLGSVSLCVLHTQRCVCSREKERERESLVVVFDLLYTFLVNFDTQTKFTDLTSIMDDLPEAVS